MTNKILKNILYAEDESDIREIANIALEDIGNFTVKYCANGLEVLETVKSFQPDLIILDVMMPKLDGPSTLIELRKIPQYMHLPVIFMTAKAQEDTNPYLNMGVIAVINKPFDPMELPNLILQAWEKFHG